MDGGSIGLKSLAEGDDYFRVEVTDTGVGIALEDQALLFAPFERLDQSNTKEHRGMGLGLSLVKRVAEAQGGAVGFESKVNEGSCFWAVLPRDLDAM